MVQHRGSILREILVALALMWWLTYLLSVEVHRYVHTGMCFFSQPTWEASELIII